MYLGIEFLTECTACYYISHEDWCTFEAVCRVRRNEGDGNILRSIAIDSHLQQMLSVYVVLNSPCLASDT
jgi:hypothetical protein